MPLGIPGSNHGHDLLIQSNSYSDPGGCVRRDPSAEETIENGQPHKPKTYSTVALRCSLSSGVRTSLLWDAGLGPDATATYCLPLTSNVIGGAGNPDPTITLARLPRPRALKDRDRATPPCG